MSSAIKTAEAGAVASGTAEALLARGRALFAAGRLSEADRALADAVAAAPLAPAGHANRAIVAQRMGRGHAALAAVRRAVALDPGRDALWRLHGSIMLGRDDGRGSVSSLARWTLIRPDDAASWAALGEVRHVAGDRPGAAAALRASLCLAPVHLAPLMRLAVVADEGGDAATAEAMLRRAEVADPTSPAPLNNRAALRRSAGRLAEALSDQRAALARAPAETELWGGLAAVLVDLGRDADAEAAARRGVCLVPDRPDPLLRLASLLSIARRRADAERAARRVALMDHESSEAWRIVGEICLAAGEVAGARAAFEHRLRRAPGDLVGRLAMLETELPVVASDEAEIERGRARWLAGLDVLAQAVDWSSSRSCEAALAALSAHSGFYSACHGRDDRPLRQRHGRLLARAAALAYAAVRMPAVLRRVGGRMRIGVVSSHVRRHAVWSLFGGWWGEIDRSRFELVAYSLTRERDDVTDAARGTFDRFVDAPRSPERLLRQVAEERFDAIIYPEIGIDRATLRLAASRLAPVQAMAWGHPVTSGLPTIDAFLSSEMMEPEDGDRHYAERLVRLPNLSIRYEPSGPPPPACPALEALHDEGRVLVVCPHRPNKLLPRHDEVYPRIAKAAPAARFVFLADPTAEATRIFRDRLAASFQAHGVDARDHVEMVAMESPVGVAGLLRDADLYLDNPGWSGGSTTLEAIEFGTPVVTCPLGPMRGRHSAAILRRMRLDDLVAPTVDAHVAIAAALVRDGAARREIRELALTRRERLYRDPEPVRALERFLEGAAGAG